MEEPAPTTRAPESPSADNAGHAQERFPFSTKDMVRQIYLLSGAVIALLSLAIWLMISLS